MRGLVLVGVGVALVVAGLVSLVGPWVLVGAGAGVGVVGVFVDLD